jgi:hypothetical protein
MRKSVIFCRKVSFLTDIHYQWLSVYFLTIFTFIFIELYGILLQKNSVL